MFCILLVHRMCVLMRKRNRCEVVAQEVQDSGGSLLDYLCAVYSPRGSVCATMTLCAVSSSALTCLFLLLASASIHSSIHSPAQPIHFKVFTQVDTRTQITTIPSQCPTHGRSRLCSVQYPGRLERIVDTKMHCYCSSVCLSHHILCFRRIEVLLLQLNAPALVVLKHFRHGRQQRIRRELPGAAQQLTRHE